MDGSRTNRLMENSRLKVAFSAISLFLCIFATYYFLVVLKTAIIYTHLFYIPIVITCAWWGRKGILLALSIVIFLLAANFFLAPHISEIDNLARSAILVSVSILTSFIFVSRKKTEEKLGFLKSFNEKVVNSVGDALLVIDPNNFQIISANDAALKQLKVSKNDLVGKTCYEVTHHRSTSCETPNDICPIHEMLTTGIPVIVEHQHFDKENRRIDIEVSVHPIKDKDGKIIQAVHIDRDITSRKDQERAAKTRTEEIQGIINGIGDLLFVMDKNRVITEVNKSTCEAFKKKPEELIGKHCYEIVHGTSCPWPDCPATETFKTKQTVTKEITDPNLGKPLLITTSPILDEQGEVSQIIHIAKDITSIKLAEMEMHISANLFEAASDSIMVHDLNGKLIYFNEAAYKTRGYTREEFQALSIQDLEAQGKPEFFESKMKDLLNNREASFEAVNLRKDKTVIPVEIHAQVIEFDGQKVVLSVTRDISERKKAEEKQKEDSERIGLMNEKLRVVGGLSRHDVRNKLSTVTGYAYLLKKKHADQADIVEGLGKMEQAVKESMKIFEFAKMYEQLGVEELTPIDVEAKLNEAATLFSGSLPNIINKCHGLTVLADSFLRQLFYNFIDNTKKYGQKTNTIRVHYEKTDQENLKLVYEDDGVGIPLENKTNLFKEGFSTGGSTGFGLFLTQKMMDIYGWEIEENGEPGIGAKFIITIPKLNKNGKENYQIT